MPGKCEISDATFASAIEAARRAIAEDRGKECDKMANFLPACASEWVKALTSVKPTERKTNRMTTESIEGVASVTGPDIKDAERVLARKVENLDDLELATLRLDALRFAKELDKITSQGFNSIEDIIDVGDQILQFTLNGKTTTTDSGSKEDTIGPKVVISDRGLYFDRCNVVIIPPMRRVRIETPSGHVIIGFTDAPKEFGTDLSKFMSKGPGETAADAGGQQ